MKTMLFKAKLSLFPVDLEKFWDEKILAKYPRNWGGSRRIGARKMGGVLYHEILKFKSMLLLWK